MNHAASGKLRSVVAGLGSYLPKRIVSNADLEKALETTDAWIVQRTGIRQRHVAAADEPTSRLGLYAAEAALADAGLKASDLDLVIVATSTPDFTFPSVATQIQA
ncbi:MAG: 3-oxoacyl-ACP synthase, partial [Methylocella sp.]